VIQQSKKRMASHNIGTFFESRDNLLTVAGAALTLGGINMLVAGVNRLRADKGSVAAGGFDDLVSYLPLDESARRMIATVMYIVMGIAALGMLAYAYLRANAPPDALDTAFFPSTLAVAARVPKSADAAVRVKTTPFAKVAYWAARSELEADRAFDSPNEAYGDYTNAGMVVADAKGEAVLRFRRPARYMARGKLLDRHVHYRTARASIKDTNELDIDAKRYETHMWSPVQTVYKFQTF